MTARSRQAHKVFNALVPPGAGGDLLASRHAGLARIEPRTLRGTHWLRSVASSESSWDGSALIVEMRYFPEVADAAIEAKLTFEREELIT